MDERHYHNYLLTHDEARANRLFGTASSYYSAPAARAWENHPLEAQRFLSVTGSTLHIAAFRICKWGQVYINPEPMAIDLERLPADRYKIIAVHNFRVEDRNPRLNECRAGVFLARRVGLRWEEAEDHPVECRSIEVLGYVDTVTRRVTPP